jgi:hypothetical protein
MASGEWRIASGEWRMASCEWRIVSGELRIAGGDLVAGCSWTIDNGQLTMDRLPRPEIGLQKKADHRPHETSNGITMDGTLC